MLTNLNTHTITRSLTGVLLSQLVNNERGFDAVCRERRWSKIALKMGFAPGKAIGSHLRSHYERILYPYNLFQTGANLLVSQMGLLLSLFLSPPLYILHSLFFFFLTHSLARSPVSPSTLSAESSSTPPSHPLCCSLSMGSLVLVLCYVY